MMSSLLKIHRWRPGIALAAVTRTLRIPAARSCPRQRLSSRASCATALLPGGAQPLHGSLLQLAARQPIHSPLQAAQPRTAAIQGRLQLSQSTKGTAVRTLCSSRAALQPCRLAQSPGRATASSATPACTPGGVPPGEALGMCLPAPRMYSSRTPLLHSRGSSSSSGGKSWGTMGSKQALLQSKGQERQICGSGALQPAGTSSALHQAAPSLHLQGNLLAFD